MLLRLLGGLAGFGAPVAVTCAMLRDLVRRSKAAVVTVVGSAISVGFGAMAIPATTAGKLSGAGPVVVAGDMGHPDLDLLSVRPFLMLFILDSGRNVQLFPPSSRVPQPATARFFLPSVSLRELTAVVASLLGFAPAASSSSGVPDPRIRPTTDESDKSPPGRASAGSAAPTSRRRHHCDHEAGQARRCFLLLTDVKNPARRLRQPADRRRHHQAAIYSAIDLSNPGTWIFVTGIIVAIVYGTRL